MKNMGKANSKDLLELEAKNFGPIVEAKVDLRLSTLFVGPSNTGKSYLAVLIYALHRIFGTGHGYRQFLPADRAGVMHAHRTVVSALVGRATSGGIRQQVPTPMLSGVLADFLEQLIALNDVPNKKRGHAGVCCHRD